MAAYPRTMSINRRQLLQGAGLAGLGLLAGCGWRPGQAPAPEKLPMVGFIVPGVPGVVDEAFKQGLREFGYEEGRNILIESRHAEFREERISALAADLVRRPVDLVVANALAVPALRQLTTSIPIVMATSLDPVGEGWVASLARPGGNITGLSLHGPELSTKRLELIQNAVPHLRRLAVVWNVGHPNKVRDLQEIESAAHTLGIQVLPWGVRDHGEIERRFEAGEFESVEALSVVADPVISYYAGRIAEFALARRLPTISEHRDFVMQGGLMTYGPSVLKSYQRAAYYVDRILKGTPPAELPVEQPREFEFVINLKTAQALGLTIPQHVLLQATEIIQ